MSAWINLGSPVWGLLGLAAVVAALPVAWVWLRKPGADTRARLAALTALTLFLTFDLIVFGAFTRLTDSGLGCPDWPGCYGELHPVAAAAHIEAAQAAQPTGPVTHRKAWIEMIHRYLAMLVGALVTVLAAVSWRVRHGLPHRFMWPLLTWVWVLVQGGFGRYTVTLKLYPAVVTAHLLGAMLLLALLVVQHHRYQQAVATPDPSLRVSSRMRGGVMLVLALLLGQIALGGWVSSNYAVLACQGFPQCNGQWWPAADFDQGFTLLRELGRDGDGSFLSLPALVAIHLVHRLMALLLSVGLLRVVYGLWGVGRAGRPWAACLLGLWAAQMLSGIGNVVLDWPLFGALAHSAGAAALLVLLLRLLLCSAPATTAVAPAPVASSVWSPAP